MKIEFDHVGILVCDVQAGLESLLPMGWPLGDVDTFPSEGTKELYVGSPSATGLLLLIEPIGDGPYKQALAKRGPGLHHIAVNVDDALAFTDRIAGSGWYLHPTSLRTFKQHKTLWLARPGVPLLLEVVQRKVKARRENAQFISLIEVALPEAKPLLASAIGVEQFQSCAESGVYITIDGVRKKLEDIVALGSS